MAKAHDGFLVKQHRPLFKWVVTAFAACLLVITFFLGRWDQERVLDNSYKLIQQLKIDIEQLTERNDALVKKNTRLSADGKVDRDAYNAVNETLINLQQEILYLKEELVFYRGIVAPSKSDYSVNLQEFSLLSEKEKNTYSYKIVLTKSGRSNYSIRGNVNLKVEGLLNGKSHSFALKELNESDKNKLKYSFRYFQIFEGIIKLPEQFYPEKVKVLVKSKTKKVKSIENTFNWAEILPGES